jgi:hypothetical protein
VLWQKQLLDGSKKYSMFYSEVLPWPPTQSLLEGSFETTVRQTGETINGSLGVVAILRPHWKPVTVVTAFMSPTVVPHNLRV